MGDYWNHSEHAKANGTTLAASKSNQCYLESTQAEDCD
jgi:hypothetical protein